MRHAEIVPVTGMWSHNLFPVVSATPPPGMTNCTSNNCPMNALLTALATKAVSATRLDESPTGGVGAMRFPIHILEELHDRQGTGRSGTDERPQPRVDVGN